MLSETPYWYVHIDGLMQDCSISSANALEILQSYTKPLTWLVSASLWQWLMQWIPDTVKSVITWFAQNIYNP